MRALDHVRSNRLNKRMILTGVAGFAIVSCIAGTPTGDVQPGTGTLPTPISVVRRVDVTPVSPRIVIGAILRLSAVPTDSAGDTLSTVPVSWNSGNASIATVDSFGNASGVSVGAVTIEANADGVVGTASLTVGSPTATLVSIAISPKTASLDTGTSRVFTALGTFSDNSTAGVPVTFSVSGLGSVNAASGLYNAGPSAGTSKVIVRTTDGSSKADTATVSISIPSPVLPWIAEDFSSYTSTADMFANPRGDFLSAWDEYKSRISLDQTVGFGSSTKSMLYSFPDRTLVPLDFSDPSISKTANNRCSDISIQRYMPLPTATNEVWLEVYAKFAANFTTVAPTAWVCTNNPDYKFIFFRVLPEPERYEIKAGVYGIPTFLVGRYPGGPADTPPIVRPPTIFDGQWHRFRMHGKVNTAGQNNGAYQAWMDDILFYNANNVSIPYSIVGIWLGANLNQGPATVQNLWWGRVIAYDKNPGW